jgi:hypothetical protein
VLAVTYAGVIAACAPAPPFVHAHAHACHCLSSLFRAVRRWVMLLVLFLMKARHTPLYYTPGAPGTRGNTYFNVALSCTLLATTLAVAVYTGSRLYRLRVRRRLRWADRGRAIAAAQRQARIMHA